MGKLLDLPLDDLTGRDACTAIASTLMPFPEVAVHRVHNVALLRQGMILREHLVGV